MRVNAHNIAVFLGVMAGVILGVILIVLWVDKNDPPTAKDIQLAPQQPVCSPEEPCLAIVIDDVGRDLTALRALLAIPLDLTFAVLPHASHTAASVSVLAAAKRDYLLHLPLQPQNKAAITDEPLVLSATTPITRDLRRCLALVPGARGINNHMGSAFTSDPDALDKLFGALSGRDLFILDSRTTASSQLCQRAGIAGFFCLERDVFLDDPSDPATVHERLGVASKLARERGWAVAIGHPRLRTIAALRALKAEVFAKRVVRLSKLVEIRNVP